MSRVSGRRVFSMRAHFGRVKAEYDVAFRDAEAFQVGGDAVVGVVVLKPEIDRIDKIWQGLQVIRCNLFVNPEKSCSSCLCLFVFAVFAFDLDRGTEIDK